MCYNYSQYMESKELEKEFNRKMIEDEPEGFRPYFNADGFTCPKMPIISSDNPDAIQLAEWGFIPGYASDPNDPAAKKQRFGTLNAKSETLFELKSFKDYAATQHCLILSTGFFEPHHSPDGTCTYYFITTKSRKAFAFGGLWKTWKDKKTGIYRKNFTMITVPPTPMLTRIHNKKPRMPFIVPQGEERNWLSSGISRPDIEALMRTYDDSDLQAWPVSKLANLKRNVPEVIQREEPTDPGLILENMKVLGLIPDSETPNDVQQSLF